MANVNASTLANVNASTLANVDESTFAGGSKQMLEDERHVLESKMAALKTQVPTVCGLRIGINLPS